LIASANPLERQQLDLDLQPRPRHAACSLGRFEDSFEGGQQGVEEAR
jgi:hypothetical protein